MQSYLWMQGDIMRSQNMSLNNNAVLVQPSRGQSSVVRISHTSTGVTKLLNKVDSMKLDDTRTANGSDTNANHEQNYVSQGDRLNQIKAMRRHPRSATSGGLTPSAGSKQLVHVRTKTQPFRSTSSSQATSPLKSTLKGQGSAAPVIQQSRHSVQDVTTACSMTKSTRNSVTQPSSRTTRASMLR